MPCKGTGGPGLLEGFIGMEPIIEGVKILDGGLGHIRRWKMEQNGGAAPVNSRLARRMLDRNGIREIEEASGQLRLVDGQKQSFSDGYPEPPKRIGCFYFILVPCEVCSGRPVGFVPVCLVADHRVHEAQWASKQVADGHQNDQVTS